MANANPTLFDYAQQEVEYRDIPGYPGYRVGSDGTVWSCFMIGSRSGKKGGWRQLRHCRMKWGHLAVALRGGGKIKTFLIHRLVLDAFVSPRPSGMECCHYDGNPANNALSNLRWGTPAENTLDKIRHNTCARGSRIGAAKLTEAKVLTIKKMLADGVSNKVIAEAFDVDPSAISHIARGFTWRHV